MEVISKYYRNVRENPYLCTQIGFIENDVARKKKELPLLEKVTIMDVAAEGKAVAKVNELVVFVPYVVP